MHARSLLFAGAITLLVFPLFASAFPFGGRIVVYHVCYNETIFTRLSPPVPGDYVWTRATKTYLFGPPRNVGQWLLGLTGIPYDCLWSVSPIYVQPAISIMMMGSSGPAAPGYSAPSLQAQGLGPGSSGSGGSGTAGGGGGTGSGGGGGSQTAKLMISEVYYDVDWAHGDDPQNEWVELYNGTGNTVDLSGWVIQNAGGSDTLPAGSTIPAGKYVIIAAMESTKDTWQIPTGTKIIVLNNNIGNGLSNSGDVVRIKSSALASPADAVSWGSNTSAFSPSVPVVPDGHSMARSSLTKDTDTAADWVDRTTPTPGK